MDLSTVNKHSPWSLAISSIFFSCFGGMKLGWGIQQFAAASQIPVFMDRIVFDRFSLPRRWHILGRVAGPSCDARHGPRRRSSLSDMNGNACPYWNALVRR